jgi:hypothetical protein
MRAKEIPVSFVYDINSIILDPSLCNIFLQFLTIFSSFVFIYSSEIPTIESHVQPVCFICKTYVLIHLKFRYHISR